MIPGLGVKSQGKWLLCPSCLSALFLSGVTGGSSFGECPAHNCLIFLSIHSFIHSLIHAKFLEHLVYAASLLDAAVLLVSRRGSQSRRKVVH